MRRIILAVVVVGAVLGCSAVAAGKVPGQRLADALLVTSGDVPKFWIRWPAAHDRILNCLAISASATFTTQARSSLGTPNSGVVSEATVLASRVEANRYYNEASTAIPACIRSALRTRHPTHIWDVQALSISTAGYGVRSGAGRVRYMGRGERHGFDWALLNTGTAVLVDLFDMGAYDVNWHDMSAARGLGGSVLTIEHRVLANAARRATNR